jgi:hypothetical protein
MPKAKSNKFNQQDLQNYGNVKYFALVMENTFAESKGNTDRTQKNIPSDLCIELAHGLPNNKRLYSIT